MTMPDFMCPLDGYRHNELVSITPGANDFTRIVGSMVWVLFADVTREFCVCVVCVSRETSELCRLLRRVCIRSA